MYVTAKKFRYIETLAVTKRKLNKIPNIQRWISYLFKCIFTYKSISNLQVISGHKKSTINKIRPNKSLEKLYIIQLDVGGDNKHSSHTYFEYVNYERRCDSLMAYHSNISSVILSGAARLARNMCSMAINRKIAPPSPNATTCTDARTDL